MGLKKTDSGDPGAASSWRKRRLALAVLLLMATGLRLWESDLVPVTADEGSHVGQAMFIAVAGLADWPLAGLPSLGVRNSALFIYLVTLAEMVWWHPLSGVVLVAGLNVAAIWLAWRFAWRYLGPGAAWFGCVLWTVSPWSVIYGRTMWPPSCLAVVTVLLWGAGLEWLQQGGRRRLAWLGFLSVVLPQVHFSGLCALPWLAVVLWSGRKQLLAWPLLGGLFAGVLTWAPWILFHMRNGLDAGVGGFLQGKQGIVETVGHVLTDLQSLLHSGGFSFWFGLSSSELPGLFPSTLRAAATGVAVLLVTGLLASSVLSLRCEKSLPARLLLWWIAMPVIGLVILRPQIQPHYLLVAYPAPWLLLGWGVGRLVESRPRMGRVAVTALAVTVVVHGMILAGWYRYVSDGQNDGRGQFQLSYRQRRAAVMVMIEDFAGRRIPLAGSFNGTNPRYEFIYRFEQFRRNHSAKPIDRGRRYFVEVPRPDQSTAADAVLRRINQTLSSGQPNTTKWQVEQNWQVGPTHIHRIRRVVF